MLDDDFARSMRDPAVRERRRSLLHAPHVEPLTAYAATLRSLATLTIPEFDPFDGGVEAEVLFLFEKPGPMTAEGGKREGSGFISRNNDDPSAEATFEFMKRAGIPRKSTVSWNLIPGWNGTRKVTTIELRDGMGRLRELISLLPRLRAVVLVGQKAAKAQPFLEQSRPELVVLISSHPSPLVKAKYPKRWHAIPAEWAKVLPCVTVRES